MRPIARCVHHDPRSMGACAAGVRYRDVYVAGVGPCITLNGRPDRRSVCAKYEPVPDAQLDAEERQMLEALERFRLGTCPECGTQLEQLEFDRTALWKCKQHGVVARGCKRTGEPE